MAGECNRADAPQECPLCPLPNVGGTTQIDPDNVCFSCFSASPRCWPGNPWA